MQSILKTFSLSIFSAFAHLVSLDERARDIDNEHVYILQASRILILAMHVTPHATLASVNVAAQIYATNTQPRELNNAAQHKDDRPCARQGCFRYARVPEGDVRTDGLCKRYARNARNATVYARGVSPYGDYAIHAQ